MRLRQFLVAASLCSISLAAHASSFLTGAYNVTVDEGLSNGVGFDTTGGNPFSGSNTAHATFVYTGPLDFSNTAANNTGPAGDLNSTFGFTRANITMYNGSGMVNSGTIADYTSKATFLASSGSASPFKYGSYYTFDLGVLAANTILSITHDDGISLFQGSTKVGSTVSGATSVTTDQITIPNTGDTILRYARENGTPSVLQVSAVTPEPSSLVLLGTGLLGVCGAMRRRFSSQA